MKIENLLYIKENIETMSRNHHIDVLKLLKSDSSVILNENSNGIFVNLNELSDDIINKLLKFIKYVDTQQEQLNDIEKEKINIENNYFKSNKDKNR